MKTAGNETTGLMSMADRAFLEVHYVSGERVEVSVNPARPGWHSRVRAEDERYERTFDSRQLAERAAYERFEARFPAHYCTPRCKRFEP